MKTRQMLGSRNRQANSFTGATILLPNVGVYVANPEPCLNANPRLWKNHSGCAVHQGGRRR